MNIQMEKLSSKSMQAWLENHKQAIALGINVGSIAKDKAQAFRLELIRRGETR